MTPHQTKIRELLNSAAVVIRQAQDLAATGGVPSDVEVAIIRAQCSTSYASVLVLHTSAVEEDYKDCPTSTLKYMQQNLDRLIRQRDIQEQA